MLFGVFECSRDDIPFILIAVPKNRSKALDEVSAAIPGDGVAGNK